MAVTKSKGLSRFAFGNIASLSIKECRGRALIMDRLCSTSDERTFHSYKISLTAQ